jgi:methionine aminotransferase
MKSKLPHTGTTIFSVMSKLAIEHNAVNLGQGFPGFQSDQHLSDLVYKYMREGKNQYAPMPGIPELRSVLSKKIEDLYGHEYNSDREITITSGGTQAIFTAITALVHPGDEVILFAPAYDCYAPAIELNGGKPVWLNLSYPEYRIDWAEVKSRITDRTRLIIVNSPHNPSGTCLNAEDLRALENIVTESKVLVLSDEVYEHIYFDGRRHESVIRYPNLVRRAFVVFSFGKTFHNTGWKMGYICAPEELMLEFRKVHQYNVFSCNTPVQHALAEYMLTQNTYMHLPGFYEYKRNRFLEHLKGSAWQIHPAEGTYFQLLGFGKMFQERDMDFATRLTKEWKITGIPCSVFYPDAHDDSVLRFCFAKDDDQIDRAAEILQKIK